MSLSRILATLAALWISGTIAMAARAETPYESAVQYALENLTSGITTASVYSGTEVKIMPVRTWKSVSGHYCREYQITVTEPASSPDYSEHTRCRDSSGRWRRVTGN
jgi:surface antigen